MKKIDDFFAAGVPTRHPWNDLAAVFFRPTEVFSFWAQLFGFIATFGVGITNGVILSGLLKVTGRDFAYLKSIVVASSSVMFAFMVLYPSLGLKADQHSIVTTYTALINNQFFAIPAAFLFLRLTTVGQNKATNTEPRTKSYVFSPVPARKPRDAEHRRILFKKPLKLK